MAMDGITWIILFNYQLLERSYDAKVKHPPKSTKRLKKLRQVNCSDRDLLCLILIQGGANE
jgi:hypothetical protein